MPRPHTAPVIAPYEEMYEKKHQLSLKWWSKHSANFYDQLFLISVNLFQWSFSFYNLSSTNFYCPSDIYSLLTSLSGNFSKFSNCHLYYLTNCYLLYLSTFISFPLPYWPPTIYKYLLYNNNCNFFLLNARRVASTYVTIGPRKEGSQDEHAC